MPNLEQTGLLEIHYADLDWLAEQQDRWSGTLPGAARRDDRASGRRSCARCSDEMRRSLAIDVAVLPRRLRHAAAGERGTSRRPVGAVGHRPVRGSARPTRRAPARASDRAGVFFSGRGKVGKYLRRAHFRTSRPTTPSRRSSKLLELLAKYSLVERIEVAPQQAGMAQALVRSHAHRLPRASGDPGLAAGTGEMGAHDPLTRTYASGDGPRVNRFFQQLYRDTAAALAGLVAREHTAQVAARGAAAARGRVPGGHAEAAVLLADDGAGRRHLRAERRDDAQRAADARQLRAAQRPGGPLRVSPRSSPPTAPPATATTSTTSAARTGWSRASSLRPGSTWPTRTLSAPTCRRSGWPSAGLKLGTRSRD